jgi:hypothetical protein
MTRFVTTDDLTLVLRKAYSLYRGADVAQRTSTDLDEDKENIKVADEITDRRQNGCGIGISRRGSEVRNGLIEDPHSAKLAIAGMCHSTKGDIPRLLG